MESKDKKMIFKVPAVTEDVTAEWLSAALKTDIDDESLEITRNISAGLGFLSNLVRVKIGKKDNRSGFLVKLLPHKQNVEERNLVLSEKMDYAEISFYQTFLPELLLEIPTLESYMCPFFYGEIQHEDLDRHIEHASVLILKDLKDDGFVPKPFNNGQLNQKEIELTLDFFAQFHAASMLHETRLGKKLPDAYDFFPKFYYPREPGSKQFVIHSWLENSFEPIIKLISDYTTQTNPQEKERGMELISKLLRPLAPHGQKIFDRVLKAGQEFPCAIHGDLWQNNILTSASQSSPAIKAIDWQLLGYSDPVFDLGVFLISMGSGNLTYSKYESFAKIYFDITEAIFTEKEKKGLIHGLKKRRSWEEFWNAFKTYGVSYGFIFIMLSLETFVKAEGFLSKFYEALLFLHHEMKLSEFLINLIAS